MNPTGGTAVGADSTRALRVLMVDSERTWRGGEAQLRLLMLGLREAGCHVALAAPADSAIAQRTRAESGFVFHPLKISGGVDVGAARRLRRLVVDYDVVHAHASHAHGVMALATIGLKARPRRVVSRRVDFAVGRTPASAWKYRHGADLFLAISTGVRRALRNGGVPDNRIRLVPSGIDFAKFEGVGGGAHTRATLGLDARTRIVGNVAALAPHKSQADLLRAVAGVCRAHADVHVLIVGEGALRGRLERLRDDLGLAERVTFTGFREDVLDILAGFDVFVMSSYLEGMGTSILDAQALGVPVVATNTGGIPDVVEDGASGLLVPPRDPQALEAAIMRMLADAELRQRCVAEAKRRVSGYDYRRTVYKTLDAYRELCENKPAVRSPVKGLRE